MRRIYVNVTGPGNIEELENGGREVVARHGYQVGDFELDIDWGHGEGIAGVLEVDDRLKHDTEKGNPIPWTWCDFAVTYIQEA